MSTVLISVTDKTGLDTLCPALDKLGYSFLSTGGTAKYIERLNLEVMEISTYTGVPEMMGGRLKTLHPKVAGGLLRRDDDARDITDLKRMCARRISMAVVNLYSFADVITKADTTFADAIENIDIGGPTMLRAAAKNHLYCLPVCDPKDYTELINRLSSGNMSASYKLYLAAKVFEHTAAYDQVISEYMKRNASVYN